MFRQAQQRARRTRPVAERRGIGEESLLRGGADSPQVAERAARNFHTRAPGPPGVSHRMQLDSSRKTAQVQVADRRAAAEKRIAQVPIFVSRVEIHLQAASRVVE